MKKWALLLAMVTTVYGDAVKLDMHFDQLNLKNGRAVTDVKILSYDPEQGSVAILTGRSMKKLDVQLLPDDLVKELERIAPKANEADKIKLIQREAEAQATAQRREEQARDENKADREARRKLDVATKEKAVEKETAVEDIVAKAAEDYARYYFNYENDPHSSVGVVLSTALQMDYPETVAGWSGRWRVNGTAGLAYATNTGGAVGRKVRDFEVLLEVKEKGRPKVLELRVK